MPQTAPTPFNEKVTFTSSGSIAVGRSGLGIGFPPLTRRREQTIPLTGSVTFAGSVSTLTVNNNNGDGLEILDSLTWNLPASPTFSVTNATASNVVQD